MAAPHLQDEQDIDLGRLERELVSAIEADRKYSRENDAKFRAIHQKVATYEEFRDIVKASHLSPLDRQDIVGSASRKQPWNPVAHGRENEGVGGGGQSWCVSGLPKNVQEFTREWRKLKQKSSEQQYQLLIKMGAEQLFEIFKVEIGMGVLGELLETLNQCWREEDAHRIHSILSCLPKTSRFNLAMEFLTTTEKKAASELLAKLSRVDSPHGCDSSRTTVAELAQLYTVEIPT